MPSADTKLASYFIILTKIHVLSSILSSKLSGYSFWLYTVYEILHSYFWSFYFHLTLITTCLFGISGKFFLPHDAKVLAHRDSSDCSVFLWYCKVFTLQSPKRHRWASLVSKYRVGMAVTYLLHGNRTVLFPLYASDFQYICHLQKFSDTAVAGVGIQGAGASCVCLFIML